MEKSSTPNTWQEYKQANFSPVEIAASQAFAHISFAILDGMTTENLDAKTFARNCGVRRTSVQKLLQGDSEVPLNEALKMLA